MLGSRQCFFFWRETQNLSREKSSIFAREFFGKSHTWKKIDTREKNIVNTPVKKVTIPGKFNNFSRETRFSHP